jgi:branched-chain amino acid transport system ATP-binding protein
MKDHPPDTGTALPAGPILEAAAVSKRFGGAVAVDRVSLSVPAGQIVGLIGPNGAGKTTLFDILAGDQRPTSGQVFLCGRAVESDPAHARLAAGLGRTFQIPRPFAAMTVVENVMLGLQNHAGEQVWPNWFRPAHVARVETEMLGRAMELLEFVTLASLAHEPARILSGGQRKLLELARLLMAEPRVVLLDEPAAGVNPALLDIIIERIAALNQRGITFLIVEHNMELVTQLCRQVFVMAAGEILCQGKPQEVVRDPRVIDAYLGGVAA